MNSATTCTISGIEFVPQALNVSMYDVDYESGNTADGVMHRHRIGSKYKYEITLAPIKSGEDLPGNTSGKKLKDLLQAIRAQTFNCTMPDPSMDNGGSYQALFYAGDKTVPIYSFALDMYSATTFNIIEVNLHDETGA